MEEYKPKGVQDEEKRFDPVNEHQGEIRKKTMMQKIRDEFVQEDGKSLVDYIVLDLLVPAFKDTLANMVKNTIDIVLYGGATSNRSNGGYSQPSYGNYYRQQRSQNYQRPITYSNSSPDYRDVTFENYGKATYALQQLQDATNRYGYARVGDLLDLAFLTPDPIDYKHGWADLRNARVVSAGGGRYRIELPVPIAID